MNKPITVCQHCRKIDVEELIIVLTKSLNKNDSTWIDVWELLSFETLDVTCPKCKEKHSPKGKK